MSQNPFDNEPFGLSWQHQVSDALMQHQIRIIPTSTEGRYESLECLKLRTICHLLLDHLPNEGLDEIKDAIIEAIKFYQDQLETSEPFNLGESFEVAIGESYERPVFQIAED